MQAKERVIIVRYSAPYVPGIIKVRSMAEELFIVKTAELPEDNSLVILQRAGTDNPFGMPAWRVKESETTVSGRSA